jgi:hypothetical protein
LCGFEHRNQFVSLTEKTQVLFQKLRLDLQLTSNPFPSLDKRTNHHITGERDNTNHHGEDNKAPFSFGKSLPKLIHGLVAFSFGFSTSAFNENVSRLSRSRLEGALKPTFSKALNAPGRESIDAFCTALISKFPPHNAG